MTQPKYTPAQQLDMFAPVQLGLGIDPAPARHLTDAEAQALAEIIYHKLPAAYDGKEAIDAIKTYNTDADSMTRVWKIIDKLSSSPYDGG